MRLMEVLKLSVVDGAGALISDIQQKLYLCSAAGGGGELTVPPFFIAVGLSVLGNGQRLYHGGQRKKFLRHAGKRAALRDRPCDRGSKDQIIRLGGEQPAARGGQAQQERTCKQPLHTIKHSS